MTYPKTSGFLAGSETSQEAAEHVDSNGSADGQMAMVEKYLLTVAKYHGATADDIRLVIKSQWPSLHNSIVSARLARLVNLGSIVKSAKKRRASTGRNQSVYFHVKFSDMEAVKPLQSVKKKKDFIDEARVALVAMLEVLNGGKHVTIQPGGRFHNIMKEHLE